MHEPQFVDDTHMGRPHVFLLGAGASYAAFPKGDRNGRLLPLMCNLVDILNLTDTLSAHGISYRGENFEELYAALCKDSSKKALVTELESRVYDYFSELRLPDEPTLYDHLVLSLREKDVIATFNWDPFLVQACQRNHRYAGLPHILFLHGNVAVGHCLEHRRKGNVTDGCPKCGKPFTRSSLLYPIDEKNYQDPFISAEWAAFKHYLGSAYMFTIFGYGAPTSDVEAVELMKEAWGNPSNREFEEVEIIDVKVEDELAMTWGPFIHTHHYRVSNSFYTSVAAHFPRRSCEAMWMQLMEAQFLSPCHPPFRSGFTLLRSWLEPLVEHENKT